MDRITMPSALLSRILLAQDPRQKQVVIGDRGRSQKKLSLDETHVITHALRMQTVTATTARSMIYKLLDDASDSHEPIQITGKRSSAVLVAEDDWRAIQESLYLVSIPGMRESIRSGLATPVAACAKKLDW
jgi:antitoxin YefM